MAVRNFIIVDPPHGNFYGAVGDVVYKGLVVGNYNYGFGVVHQEIFQPLNGFDI
ncbi:hypothetical protein D3C83_32870 [compost metagenome]